VNFRRIAVATVLAQLMVTVAIAQIATYDPSSGVMCVDTQGTDIVAIFITGPDVSVAGCELCDGMNLPGSDALAGTSTWTVGRSAGSTQWIRTNPLVGRGFVGSIGEFFIDGNGVSQDWPEDIPPFLDFPDLISVKRPSLQMLAAAAVATVRWCLVTAMPVSLVPKLRTISMKPRWGASWRCQRRACWVMISILKAIRSSQL
jgi:hypothetical protein